MVADGVMVVAMGFPPRVKMSDNPNIIRTYDARVKGGEARRGIAAIRMNHDDTTTISYV